MEQLFSILKKTFFPCFWSIMKMDTSNPCCSKYNTYGSLFGIICYFNSKLNAKKFPTRWMHWVNRYVSSINIWQWISAFMLIFTRNYAIYLPESSPLTFYSCQVFNTLSYCKYNSIEIKLWNFYLSLFFILKLNKTVITTNKYPSFWIIYWFLHIVSVVLCDALSASII